MMQTLLLCFALVGVALTAPLCLVLWCREHGVHPLGELLARFRRLPMFGQIVLGVIAANLIVFGSTKSPTNAPPLLTCPPPRADDPTNVVALVNGFTTNQLSAGFVLVGAMTNETWDFTMPPDAVEVGRWRARGAAEDWERLTNADMTVLSDGRLQDRLNGPELVFAPFKTALGVVPEANWSAIGLTGAESRVWSALTLSNSTVVTWQNVLFARESLCPVNFQVERFANGNFVYRYDLTQVSDAVFADAAPVLGAFRGPFGESFDLSALAAPSALSSVFFHALDERDWDTDDRDGDGLTTRDEIFVYRTDPGIADSDGDGLTDGEEINADLDPLVRDTDGDGLVDGSDPNPSVDDSLALVDDDGNGLPDLYERHWFGETNLCGDVDTYDATGFTPRGKFLSGLNPTNAASEFRMEITNELVSLKLWDSFAAAWPAGATNLVYERMVTLDRTSKLQQFFLSSRSNAAGGWSLDGLTLEWEDSSGETGTATRSPSGDSFYLTFSTNDSSRVTFRLRARANAIRSANPVYLVAYSPTITVSGGQEMDAPNGGKVVVFLKGSKSAIGLEIHRTHRPCKAALYPGEQNLPGIFDMNSLSGGAFAYEGTDDGGTVHASGAGVYQLPICTVRGAPPRRLLRAPSGSSGGQAILVLSPSVWYGPHACIPSDLAWDDHGYYVEYKYPLDSECLWREWRHDNYGGWWCDCQPGVSCGLPNGNGYAHVGYEVSGDTVTGTVYIGNEAVWSDTATHCRTAPCGYGPDIERVNECEGNCSGGCANGNCDQWEGPSLGSFRFRIPVGMPRGNQVSGFAYLMTETPLALSPAAFRYLFRPDAQVTVTTNWMARTVSCSDVRGRDLAIESIPDGVRVTVDVHATGAWEHTWELTNVDGDPARIRVRQISRLNNTMQDWLYEYVDADEGEDEDWRWRATDLIAGVREEVERDDRLNETGTIVERRITYDADGVWLGTIERTSEIVGERENATLCETSRRERTAYNEIVRTADYWRDTEHRARNGKLRLMTATDAPWNYHEWDTDGREILRLEQRNGSDVPSVFPVATSNGVENASAVADATLTVFDYTPLAGDGNHSDDYTNVRTETRYVIRAGVPTLIGRMWHRFTREESLDGWPVVKDEMWRAASPEAAFGDSGLIASWQKTFDANAASDLPLTVRGALAEELDENGVRTVNAVSFAGDRVTTVSRKWFGEEAFPTYDLVVTDAAHGMVLRRATCLTANGVVIADEQSIYDDQNRLRSTTYLDGTSITNAYSCCRKLWSRDRQGRRTLRSAVTGEDHLYYADEEVWLREICTNGQHKVVQHFSDAFGRETNAVVYVADVEGEATNSAASSGKGMSAETTTFAGLADDSIDLVDGRGKQTYIRESLFADRVVRDCETCTENGGNRLWFFESTVAVRNGRTSVRKRWNDKWTETTDFEDYDTNGCRFSCTVTASSDCGTVTNEIVRYDFAGRMIRREAPEGATDYAYSDDSRRIASETFMAGNVTRVTTWLYDRCGQDVGTETDGVASRTDLEYEERSNAWWRVTHVTESSGPVTNLALETRTQLTGLSDALREHRISVGADGSTSETRVSFDPSTALLTRTVESDTHSPVVETSKYGLVLSRSDSDGTITYAYDALGRVVLQSREKDGVSRPVGAFAYDGNDDLVSTLVYTNAESGVTETYGYDTAGHRTSVTDAHGETTTTVYDAAGNAIAEDGATYPTCSTYDTQGRRTSLAVTRNGTDWDVTRWTYDPATGRCTAKTYPDGAAETYVYTADGLLVGTIRPGNLWDERRYDERRFLTTTLSSDGAVGDRYEYDEFGRTVSASNAVAAYAYALDRRGVATNECIVVGSNGVEVVRTVDAYSRTVGLAGIGGASLSVEYDANGLIAVLSNADACVEYEYDSDGAELGYTLSLASGATFVRAVTRDRFRREQIVSLTNFCGTVPLQGFVYGYDALGRTVSRNDDGFGYDIRGEVVSALVSGTETNYVYDSIGNRIEGQANALNQYTVFGGANATYTANGGLAAAGDLTFAYDSVGRLTTVSTNGVVVLENRYDSQGRRVVLEDAEGTHVFFYDGWCPIRERIERPDGSVETVDYVWGRDLSGSFQGAGGVGGLLYLKRNGAIYVPLYDANGNVIAYADRNGNVVAEYAYDAFGQTVSAIGSLADAFRFRFSTKWHEQDTNLYYYGYRFYAPELGRWLTRDPLAEDSCPNLYNFCSNASVMNYDMLGAYSAREAWEHYKDKTGTPVWLSFDEIDTSSVSVEDFPQIRKKLSSCKPGSYDIRHTPPDDNVAFTTSGNQALFLGDVSLKLEGRLVIQESGVWNFDGTLKCYDDVYDFNKGKRSGYAEALTAIGRHTPGKEFDVNIRGSKPATGSGNCCAARKSLWEKVKSTIFG